jgi:hypothetical protein
MLKDALIKITTLGKNNFFTIQLNTDYYIQVAGQKGNKSVVLEAVSNIHLSDKNKLSEVKLAELLNMGWSLDKMYSGNFIAELEILTDLDLEKVSHFILDTARNIYQTSNISNDMIEISLDG